MTKLYRPTEHDEQVLYFSWLQFVTINAKPLRRYAFAIPNGGLRRPGVAGKLKAEGVTPGVPDVMIRVPSGPWHGMQIEAKRMGEKPSALQLDQIEACKEMNYWAVVAQGFDEMRRVTVSYLTLSWRVTDRWRG